MASLTEGVSAVLLVLPVVVGAVIVVVGIVSVLVMVAVESVVVVVVIVGIVVGVMTVLAVDVGSVVLLVVLVWVEGVVSVLVVDAVGVVSWPDRLWSRFCKLTCRNKNPGLGDAGEFTFGRKEEDNFFISSLW